MQQTFELYQTCSIPMMDFVSTVYSDSGIIPKIQ